MMLDSITLKQDFPILSRQVKNKPLVYLDNAATSQKPRQVIDAISDYYKNHNANVHRGVHTLSDESTGLWEKSRATIAHFLGADPEELIIARNTTEAINGVAYGWADYNLGKGDVILATLLDHHANIVTWQEVCKRTGAKLEFVSLHNDGKLDLDDLEVKLKKFSPKLVALPHVSNTLGVVVDIPQVVVLVKKHTKGSGKKTRILVDAAQSVPHMPVDFHELDVDFLAFSGHKMLGPMGVGGLLVRKELLQEKSGKKPGYKKSAEMRPWLFGGGMISAVRTDSADYNPEITDRFTAGTPDVASVVGLAAACEYLDKIGMKNVLEHDLDLVGYAVEELQKIPEVKIVGPVPNSESQTTSYKSQTTNPQRVGAVTFLYKGVHAHDVAQVLDNEGVAVRSGHHCTMPLHTHYGWQATVRASFQVYNSQEDVDVLVRALKKMKGVFG